MNLFKSLIQELDQPSESQSLGKGWISGIIAFILSLLCLIGVFCISFPNLLTIKEIREAIPINIFKLILQGTMLVSFLMAMISVILRGRKTLGLISFFLIIISLAIGGSNAQKFEVDIVEYSLGFDWFVINLLMSGMIFIPLEKLFKRIDQRVFRFEWREDLLYFLLSSVFVQFLTYLTYIPSNTILKIHSMEEVRVWVGSQAFILQLIVIMFLTDFIQYWVHRVFHQVPFLWKFHAVHHSAQAMDWLAGSRMHIIEIVCLRGITVIPMTILGFSSPTIYFYLILVYLYSTYIHANLRFDIECLKPFLVTPRFHHWHHGIEKEAIDKNFAIHFPIFDRLFGTYYMPKGEWPSGYGVGGHPVPKGLIKQFLYPFVSKKKSEGD